MLEVYIIGFVLCLAATHGYCGYKGLEVDFFANLGMCFAWPLVLIGGLAEFIGDQIKEASR